MTVNVCGNESVGRDVNQPTQRLEQVKHGPLLGTGHAILQRHARRQTQKYNLKMNYINKIKNKLYTSVKL